MSVQTLELCSRQLKAVPSLISYRGEVSEKELGPGSVMEYLTIQEYAQWHDTYHYRNTWLLGRIAGKRALFQYLKSMGYCMSFRDIVIGRADDGSPVAYAKDICTGQMQALPVSLSIAHTDSIAVACVIESGERSVGIDIEKIRSFRDETLRAFLTSGEYEWVKKEGNKKFETVLWCLKEAYLKAIKTGLCIHPRRVVIGDPRECIGRVCIHVDGQKVPVESAWTITAHGYIIASIIV